MLEIQVLNNLAGDRKKKIDTSKPEGRVEAREFLSKLKKGHCAIFVERKNTYRVCDYDPKTDTLKVTAEKRVVSAAASKSKVVAVAPVRGGRE